MRWIAVAASGTPELGNVSMSTFAKRKRASAKAPARGDAKTIHLVRHGRTEMNDYLRENHWADPDFVDPMMIDTRLTSEGEAQARALRTIATALEPAPELIVASPLRRALRTAELAFGGIEAAESEIGAALQRGDMGQMKARSASLFRENYHARAKAFADVSALLRAESEFAGGLLQTCVDTGRLATARTLFASLEATPDAPARATQRGRASG